jgi:hypothetical protein
MKHTCIPFRSEFNSPHKSHTRGSPRWSAPSFVSTRAVGKKSTDYAGAGVEEEDVGDVDVSRG